MDLTSPHDEGCSPQPSFGLRGQRCVVLGAASGIGQAIAREFAAHQGATVVCVDLDGLGAERTANGLREGGCTSAFARTADVTDVNQIREMFADLRKHIGGFDVVVNAAGIIGPTGHESHKIDVADFERVCRVNLTGAFIVTREAMPHLLPQAYGRVLHIASISGKDGNARMAPYSASKAGLIGLVKAQGKEYATTGVTINAVAPAVIQTPMLAEIPDGELDSLLARIPMGRFGTLKEVAHLAAFICSPACTFTTGFTFDLSGGRAVY